jgi:hypothetical protein
MIGLLFWPRKRARQESQLAVSNRLAPVYLKAKIVTHLVPTHPNRQGWGSQKPAGKWQMAKFAHDAE